MPKARSRAGPGHTLIELVVVMVLITILAGAAFFGIIRAVDLYTMTTRDYLEVFQEGKIALEKIVRELRETTPGNVSVGSESIVVTKKSGHTTEADTSLAISFFKSGDSLQRSSSAGSFDLAENVAIFSPSKNADTGVVTIDLTLTKGSNTVRLRTAALPRQKPSPIPTP